MTPGGYDHPTGMVPVSEATNDFLKEFDSIRTDIHDYKWPTDASTSITSSFGEYRSLHFHGGLDISTKGEVGHNVFAVRDGYVYRISIEPNSYGKMLFIRHADGYYSVYAHLQRFSDKIEKIAREEQLRRESYVINKTFDTPLIEVKKGEIIAYSGDTGVGPPHLHFEIRDENLNNVNPMIMFGDSLNDKIPPSITGIAIFPTGMNSTIDGKEEPKYMGRFARGKGVYKIPQTIQVHGTVGFGIRAFDRENGTRSKSGIYRVELYLDDKLKMYKELDRFPATQTKQIFLDYDLTTITEGKGEFQKLYADEGTSLPFYHSSDGSNGTINTAQLSEGEHSYRIVCKDFKNNASTLQGKLFINHTPAVELASVTGNTIVLKSPEQSTLSKFTVFGRTLSKAAWAQTIVKNANITRSDSTITVAYDSKKYDLLKIIAESKLGIAADPLVYFLKKPAGPKAPVTFTFEEYADYVRVTMTTTGLFTSQPQLTIKEGSIRQSIPLEMKSISEYSGVFQPYPDSGGIHIAEFSGEVNGIPTATTERLQLYAISPISPQTFEFGNEGIFVSSDSGAVYKPLFLEIDNKSTPTTTKYDLYPTDAILNKGLNFSVPVLESQTNGKYGLYFRNGRGWVFQTSTLDPAKKFFNTTLNRTLGELTVLKDDQPPSVARLRIAQSKGVIVGSFSYSDNLSGINFDEMKVFVDDKLVIPEIDDEHHRAWFEDDERLSAGKHSVMITVKDRMNNEMKVTRSIKLKASSPPMP